LPARHIKRPSARGRQHAGYNFYQRGEGILVSALSGWEVRVVFFEDIVNGHWHNLAGGSRPGSRLLMLSRLPDKRIALDLHYVFDHDRSETESLGFIIDEDSFADFLQIWRESGAAALESNNDSGSIKLEAKTVCGRHLVKLVGRSHLSFGGPISFAMADFAELSPTE